MLETFWPYVIIASLLLIASRIRYNFKIETEEKTSHMVNIIRFYRFYPNVENSF